MITSPPARRLRASAPAGWCAALFAVWSAAGAQPAMSPTEISYGQAEHQKLDLYLPAGPPKPLVVYIHGGAWVSGVKESYQQLGRTFAARGVAAAVVDYRLSEAPAPVRFPEHARDVARAVAILKERGTALGFDPSRIVLVGHSAGAHIAATLALEPEFRDLAAGISGYVGIEGIYDIPALVRRWPTYRDWFINLAFGSNPAGWRAASPQYGKSEIRRPWLLIHSTRDELVDTGQTQNFYSHLRRIHMPATLDLSADQTHFGVIESLASPGDARLAKILQLVASCRSEPAAKSEKPDR